MRPFGLTLVGSLFLVGGWPFVRLVVLSLKGAYLQVKDHEFRQSKLQQIKLEILEAGN
jgi:hypothetical protein